MSEYTDGYNPQTIIQNIYVWNDSATPTIGVNVTLSVSVGEHPAESEAALAAGAAAVKASLEASFPGETASTGSVLLEGSKQLS